MGYDGKSYFKNFLSFLLKRPILFNSRSSIRKGVPQSDATVGEGSLAGSRFVMWNN